MTAADAPPDDLTVEQPRPGGHGAPKLERQAFLVIFMVNIVVALGNTGMQSVLPAIGREIGIPDPLVAAVFSLSALLWAVTSPYWARRSDQVGRKPMMVLGMAAFAVSMTLCGIVVSLGVRHVFAPLAIFVAFLLCRAIFGAVGSASPPATQAYVAERTSRAERTQQLAALAGAFGLGTVIGPAIAPLMVLPVVGLAGPLFGFALMALASMFAVIRLLPERRPAPVDPHEAENEAEVRAGAVPRMALWRDPRLQPFLIYGFLVASAQTLNVQVLGFMIIDKLQLPPLQAQGYITIAMMMGAVAGLLAQWGLIRIFDMGPKALMRWGAGLAAVANLMTVFVPFIPNDPTQPFGSAYVLLVIAYGVASLGYGLARPGFSAGASLSVGPAEQGRSAGLVAAINGATVIVAPVLGVWMYQHLSWSPFVLNLAVLLAMLLYALTNPALRGRLTDRVSEDELRRAHD